MNTRELIVGKNPRKILVADKPLLQGGIPYQLTVEQFESKFGFIYSESLHGSQDDISYLANNPHRLSAISETKNFLPQEQLQGLLDAPLEDTFVICKINDEVGYGVFTKKAIPANTVLLIYAGEISDVYAADSKNAYSYGWAKTDLYQADKAINALNVGGISRFLQHLPCDREKFKRNMESSLRAQFGSEILRAKNIDLSQFVESLMPAKGPSDVEFDRLLSHDPELKKQTVTDNISVQNAIVNGVPVSVLRTNCDIPANAQLGFSYGPNYWESCNITPRYFLDDGSLIPLESMNPVATATQTSPTLFSAATNPLKLYRETVMHYKDKEFAEAKPRLLRAVELYQTAHPEGHKELVTCQSTLASCHRELGEIDDALSVCAAAIHMHNKISPLEANNKLEEKYTELLSLQVDVPVTRLYEAAVSDYKQGGIDIALLQSAYLTTKASGELAKLGLSSSELIRRDTTLQLAKCQSLYTSCLRDLGKVDMAVEQCQQALSLRMEVHLDNQHKDVTSLQKKLDGLLEVQQNNNLAHKPQG
jgi:hypothetical protein